MLRMRNNVVLHIFFTQVVSKSALQNSKEHLDSFLLWYLVELDSGEVLYRIASLMHDIHILSSHIVC